MIETVSRHLRESYGNPSSRHGLGRKARRVLEDSREQIAAILGAMPSELVFTSGGTEAKNLAVFGLTPHQAGSIVISPGEHPSNLEACRVRERQGWRLETVPVDGSGLLQLSVESLAELDWTNVRLAAVILAHNETGVIQNVDPLIDRGKEFRFAVHHTVRHTALCRNHHTHTADRATHTIDSCTPLVIPPPHPTHPRAHVLFPPKHIRTTWLNRGAW